MKWITLLIILSLQYISLSQNMPYWYEKTIIPQKEYILSVGHSSENKSLDEAKKQALSNATSEFVRYCKVDVETFSRSVEAYSQGNEAENINKTFEATNSITVKAFVRRTIVEDWFIQKESENYKASVLLKVPIEEFERISNEKNIKLSLDIVFYYEDKNGNMKEFSEGDILTSGSSYSIFTKASDMCYLYVYQADAAGKSYRLFPNKEYNTIQNPVQSKKDNWIPNNQEMFFLDETIGKEKIMVFASLNKIDEFEGDNAINLETKDILNVREIKKMGVGGLKPKINNDQLTIPKKSIKLIDIKNKLQSEGSTVYEMWFWHK